LVWSSREEAVVALVSSFTVVHSIPGRIRIHIPDWRNLELGALERRIRLVPGVRTVAVNSLTQNVLIRFDSKVVARDRVLRLLDGEVAGKAEDKRRKMKQETAILPFRLSHAPAVIGLVLSLVTCSSPLGWLRVALESLQLFSEVTSSA
jgi:hypothetical protein